MKLTNRNFFVLGTFVVAAAATGVGCSSDSGQQPIGTGNTTSGGSFTSAGTAAGGTAAGGTAAGGTAAGGTAAGGTATGGTFSSAGTDTGGTAAGGTFSSAGTDTGGTAAGGTAAGGTAAGGTAAGGTAAGGTGGTAAAGDFPANCPAPTGAHSTTALTRTCWAVTASDCAQTAQNMNPPLGAIDDAGSGTRFSTGALMATSQLFTYQIDLGTAVMVDGVNVVSMKTDFAPQLEVSLSTDGNTFTPVACGDGAVTTDFSFAPTSARYVRLVQHGVEAGSWWSIHDLNVYAASGTTCDGGGTQSEVCTTPHTQ